MARASLDDVVDGFLRTNGIVADHRMTFMERTSLRSECRRLTRFLRLVDFVVVDTLRDLVREVVVRNFVLSASSRCPACSLIIIFKIQIHQP